METKTRRARGFAAGVLPEELLLKRQQLLMEMAAAEDRVRTAVAAHDQAIRAEAAEVRDAVGQYEELVQTAQEFAGEVFAQLDRFCGDRCESWNESEEGRRFNDWAEEWDSLALVGEINIEILGEIGELDDYYFSAIEDLENCRPTAR